MLTSAPASDVLVFPAAPKPEKRRITTARSILSLPVPTTGSTEYAVEDTPGLALRITDQGNRSWSFRYANPQGQMRRIAMGNLRDITLAAARAKVSEYRQLLADDKDPAAIRHKVRTATTFIELVEEWRIKHAVPNLKGEGVEECKTLNRELATWMQRPAAEISLDDVNAVLDAKTAAGFKSAANALRKEMSRVFQFGIRRGYFQFNPVKATVPHPTVESDRVLKVQEIRSIWTACDTQTLHRAVWFKLLLVLGQRSNELLLMRWADIDPQTHWWAIPGQFTKNGKLQPVYLATMARELLALLPRRKEDGPFDPVWVFPAGDRPSQSGPTKGQLKIGANGKTKMGATGASFDVMGDYKKLAARIASPSRANIVTVREDALDRRGWTGKLQASFSGHDLRRTLTTFAASGKVEEKLLTKILNHAEEAKSNVTAIYARYYYEDEKIAIMEFWEKQLRLILAGEDVKKAGHFVMPGAPAQDTGLQKLVRAYLSVSATIEPSWRELLEKELGTHDIGT